MDGFTAGRYRVMRALVNDSEVSDKVLLDLGAGANPITASIECRLRILMDLVCRTRPTVCCEFLDGIPLAESSVDAVIAGEILEHISESRRFLGEIRRVLRDGGFLVISVPNIVSLKYRMAFALGCVPALAAKADYTYSPDNPAYPRGHVRDYSFGELQRVLSDRGFVIVAKRGIGMHWQGRRVLPPWFMPVTLSDNAIVKAVLRK